MCFKWIIKTFTIKTVQHYFRLVALFCFLILLGSLFIEHVLMIEPCILCTIQRIMFLLILITCLLALITNILCTKKPTIQNTITWLCLTTVGLYAIAGTLVAARQSWLQIFAKLSIPSCSGGLTQLLKQYSFFKIISMAIEGKLECSAIGMKILGLSLANWGFINFLIILLFQLLFIYKFLSTRKKN